MAHLGRHAIVIGASMGGLLAGRALADYYDEVTLIDRDALPLGYEPRKGVPQGRHTHGLLARGRRHAILDGLLHLFEGAHLNLAHALARHTELGCKLLKGDRIVGQSPGLEDAPLALIEDIERGDQRLVPIVALLALGENALLARCLIEKPILPFAHFSLVADWRL